ncbi:MAG: hypothetical protein GAK41_00399 [Burkholderia gladioli]|nr:MAG: hypothetical protein GAK41_00399 [Burkholderia gladioli]
MFAQAPTPAQSAVKPIPEGMHTLTPHLICRGAVDAIAFYRPRSARSKRAGCPARAAS